MISCKHDDDPGEIDPSYVAGKPLRLAVTGWLISLGPGLVIALACEGLTMTTLVVGLCLTTTALGAILPIVRDAGLVKSPFGARVLAIGILRGEAGTTATSQV